MKFACPKCNTRYSIADEKVPHGKILKFPCKTCGNVVRLRRKEGDGSEAVHIFDTSLPGALSASGTIETTRIASVSEINKLRNASTEATRTFDAMSSAAIASTETAEFSGETTRVVSIEQIDQLRRSAQAVEPEAEFEPAYSDDLTSISQPPTLNEPVEWFVLVAGKQHGPMTATAVEQMLAVNEIDRRTYLWKSGMANWERLGALPRFAGAGEATAQPAWSTAETRAVQVPASVVAKALDMQGQKAVEPAAQPAPAVAEQPMAARATTDFAFDEDFTLPDDALGEITTGSAFGAPGEGAPGFSHDNALAAQLHSEESEPLGFHKAETQVAFKPHIAAQPSADEHRTPASASSAAEPFRPIDDAPFGAPPPNAGQAPASLAAVDPLAGFDDPHNLQNFDDVSQRIQMPGDHVGLDGSQHDEGYLTGPPGESTKVHMTTAGIYKRRRNNRIAALIAVTAVVLIAGFMIMDSQGLLVVPGMGAIYDVAGVEDPNVDRALERTENKLAAQDLDPKKRAHLESLRRKLLDKTSHQDLDVKHPTSGGGTPKQPDAAGGAGEQQAGSEQHDMAEQLFDDARKQNVDLTLASPDAIQTPNLPAGLTQEAIYKVVSDNNTSMKLCYAEAARKGEKLAGKMEVQMTIDATGDVSDAQINTPQFKSSTMGQCTVRRVKTWKFPRFNGQPVTVVFPYVLQSAY